MGITKNQLISRGDYDEKDNEDYGDMLANRAEVEARGEDYETQTD